MSDSVLLIYFFFILFDTSAESRRMVAIMSSFPAILTVFTLLFLCSSVRSFVLCASSTEFYLDHCSCLRPAPFCPLLFHCYLHLLVDSTASWPLTLFIPSFSIYPYFHSFSLMFDAWRDIPRWRCSLLLIRSADSNVLLPLSLIPCKSSAPAFPFSITFLLYFDSPIFRRLISSDCGLISF